MTLVVTELLRLVTWRLRGEDDFGFWSIEPQHLLSVDLSQYPTLERLYEVFEKSSREVLRAAVSECLSAGTPFDQRLVIKTPDGCSLHWRAVGQPYMISAGKIGGVDGAFQDVSEQQAEHQMLSTSEQRYRLLANASDQVVYDWDLVSGECWRSEDFQQMFGYDSRRLGTDAYAWRMFTVASDRERVLEELNRALASSAERWSIEYGYAHSNGQHIRVFEQGHFLRGANGRVTRMIGGLTDITQKRDREELLLRSQRLESIGTLAGGLAHDLNNLLSPILLSVSLLKDTVDDPEGAELLEIVRQNAQRGSQLIRRLLDFAKGMEGERIPLNLSHVVRELREVIFKTFPRNIILELKDCKDLWMIEADPTQIYQVLMNFCVNSRDAMPQGGKLTIRLSNRTVDQVSAAMDVVTTPGHYVAIEVQDEGTGMTPEVMERLFEPFFTTKAPGEGTGLGLPTSFSIVRSHGGFVQVESELRKGSTFRVFFPADEKAAGFAGSVASEAAIPEGRGELILVVDDEEDVLKIAVKTLERHGYQVLPARHGAEAISLFALNRDKVKVTLTDMSMPIMDGESTIAALRSIDTEHRIIVSSGQAIANSVEASVNAFLAKPYSAATLLRTLHQVLTDG